MPAVRPSIPRSKRLALVASQRANLQEAWGAFANMDRRKRADVLEALMNDRGIECRNQNEGVRGRPRMAFFAPPQH
jgi:hypothetical protein